MTSECLAGARENLEKLSPTQRVGLELLKEDVMISWVGKSMKNVETGESRLLFAVTSVPAKGWIRNVSIHAVHIHTSMAFKSHLLQESESGSRGPESTYINNGAHMVLRT